MPVDGCEHAYHELVNEVSPRYMNVLRERRERMRHPYLLKRLYARLVMMWLIVQQMIYHLDHQLLL